MQKILPTPETKHFWEGTKKQQFLIQRCRKCDQVYFPPRPFCPKCWHQDIETFPASGKAVLYSYVICYRSADPDFPPPFSIALVNLIEGPQIVTNIVQCPQTPEVLILDMRLRLEFSPVNDGYSRAVFRPEREGENT